MPGSQPCNLGRQDGASNVRAQRCRATTSFAAFAERADNSLLEALQPDPQASGDRHDHRPRQVFSGYSVPVRPSPLPVQQYLACSSSLFQELGLSEALAHDAMFQRLFSGDITVAQRRCGRIEQGRTQRTAW
jgi:hypothetical protein